VTSPSLPTLDVEHSWVTAGGLRLHCAHAGMDRGGSPPLILLHGFPDHWTGWSPQMAALAENRLVIAPDGRGINLSDAPAEVGAYHLDRLVDDVLAVAEAFAPGQTVDLAGHDWGGVVAWAAISRHPERFRRLAILNAPHPGVLGEALANDPVQKAASSYVDALRAEDAEAQLAADDFAPLLAAFAELTRAGRFSEDDRQRYRQAWGRPGRLSGALNWYRAADFLEHPDQAPWPARALPHPVLMIWGEDDLALPPSLIEAHRPLAANLTVERLAGCGHWTGQEAPERVNPLLISHFAV